MPQVLLGPEERRLLHHAGVLVEVDDGRLPRDRGLDPASLDGRRAVRAVAVVDPAGHPFRVVSGIRLRG